MTGEMSGSHGGELEDDCLLGSEARVRASRNVGRMSPDDSHLRLKSLLVGGRFHDSGAFDS